MPTLFIRALSIPHPRDEGFEFSCEWLVVDPDGRHHSHGSGDFTCAPDAEPDFTPLWRRSGSSDGTANGTESGEEWALNPANVVLLAPGQHVLSVTCEVPGRNAGQIRRALPYVVEEFIAGNIEGSHIASGPVRRGQPIRCCIIDDGLLRDWLACPGAPGIPPCYLAS
ncbi:MAG: type II secretion system protein GspL, partial [Gammaproteobacteria bacterium]|nr:type II secretion system protein GspL [Gammaproteobacteria bacterium]